MSTTLREAERIIGFAKTAYELDGQEWSKDNQIKYQILLIKNRYYLSPDNTQSLMGLNEEQVSILSNLNHDLTFSEAEGIFNSKNYEDPPMRGRQSMSPLKKLGLVYIKNNKIHCTDVCKKLISEQISLEDFMFDSLVKYQYPNPMEGGYSDWNTKPFINTLRLINKVNERLQRNGLETKGITTTEFGIFVLSLKNYRDIDDVVSSLLDFRNQYNSLPQDDRQDFVLNYIDYYLPDFNNPRKNCFEYTDNMIRYLRLTKFIYLRGKYSNTYIDLEPRRMTEINSLLDSDEGNAINYTPDEWYDFIGTYGSYELPYETPQALILIAQNILLENNNLRDQLSIERKTTTLLPGVEELKNQIEELRSERTVLQNLMIKRSYHSDTTLINQAISTLNDILGRNRGNLGKRFSIELEKWANIALNIINDAIFIKPNTKVGDDNEPIFTAPAGVADIECFYESFNSICEVTMLSGRDQWFNEGQPVMRHLRDFETKYDDKDCYCFFIAPSLHKDTLNTFFFANKYGYDGRKQKIIPITIKQLITLLEKVKISIERGNPFTHLKLKQFMDDCLPIEDTQNIDLWIQSMQQNLLII